MSKKQKMRVTYTHCVTGAVLALTRARGGHTLYKKITRKESREITVLRYNHLAAKPQYVAEQDLRRYCAVGRVTGEVEGLAWARNVANAAYKIAVNTSEFSDVSVRIEQVTHPDVAPATMAGYTMYEVNGDFDPDLSGDWSDSDYIDAVERNPKIAVVYVDEDQNRRDGRSLTD